MTFDVEAQLCAALERSAAAVGLFDADEQLRYANASFFDAFAIEAGAMPTWEEMMRRCHRDRRGLLIEADDVDVWLAKVRRSHRKVPHRTFESDLVDGRWMRVTETLLESGWVLVLASDITALKANESTLRHAHEQAVQRSLTDPLTGLHNRRFIFDRLDELLVNSRSMRYPLAVAVLDLDGFKQLNDRYGHGVGDRILIHFARTVRPQLRPLDLVGRVGGEEFLIVFPNATLEGARQALDRLHRQVAESVPIPEQPQLRYGFSAGLTLACVEDNADHLYHRADVALYRAKSEGRGRSVVIESGTPPG